MCCIFFRFEPDKFFQKNRVFFAKGLKCKLNLHEFKCEKIALSFRNKLCEKYKMKKIRKNLKKIDEKYALLLEQ